MFHAATGGLVGKGMKGFGKDGKAGKGAYAPWNNPWGAKGPYGRW